MLYRHRSTTLQQCDNCLGISVSAVRFRVRFTFQFPVFPCARHHTTTRPSPTSSTRLALTSCTTPSYLLPGMSHLTVTMSASTLPLIFRSLGMYRISGNFHVIKGSREKFSRSKIFALWAFHENLTRGENVEEYGRDWCIRGCHVYLEI